MSARRLVFYACLGLMLLLAVEPGAPAAAAPAAQNPTPTPDAALTAQAYVVTQIALELYQDGEYEESLSLLEEALSLYVQAGDGLGAAWSYFRVGVVCEELAEYEQALENYDQAAQGFAGVGDVALEAEALNCMGLACLTVAACDRDAEIFLEAAEAYRQVGDVAGEGMALNNAGMSYYHQGAYAEALYCHEQALAMHRSVKDRSREVTTLVNLGLVHWRLAHYEDALQYYEQALDLSRQAGAEADEARSLNNIAIVYSEIADYAAAIEYQVQALDLYAELGDRYMEASAYNNLAINYDLQSDYEQALSYYQQALTIFQEIADRGGEAATLMNMGVVYGELGDYERALAYLEEASTINEEIGDRSGEAMVLNNVGVLLTQGSAYEESLDFYLQALAIYQDLGDQASEADTLANAGIANSGIGDQEEALSYLSRALSIYRLIGDPAGEAMVLYNMGIAREKLGDYDEALLDLERALEIRQDIGDRAGAAKVLQGLGDLSEKQGDEPGALQYYSASIEARESVLAGVRVESFRIALAGQEVDVYQAAVRLLAAMGRGVEAFEVAERSRARAFLDGMGNQRLDLGQAADAGLVEEERELRGELAALESDLVSEKSLPAEEQNEQVVESIEAQVAEKQGEYEDLLAQLELANPELASLVTIETATVTETQALLDEETTLIAYYLAGQEGLAFVLSEEEFELVELGATAEEIGQAVASFRSLGLANLDNAYPRSLSDLYAWLIEPLLPYLDTPQVGIVPHQTLHYVPFAALHDGEEYLGEQYVLFHLPSASALPYIEEKAGREGAGAVVLGDPETGNPDLGALEYAGREAEQVAGLLGVEALLGEEAGEAALGEAVGGAGVVHVAAHGSFNAAAPLFSRLWLAPGEGEDGRLNVYEVYGLDLERASVVVLSACQTQVGELSAGDEVVGLNRAFLYGAPTVVASLWPVDDEATGVLMVSFYSHLLEGKGKAEALQAAQEEVRRDEEHPQWAHPYYWAGFVLSGDGGVVEGLAGESAGEGQGICPSAAILPLGLALAGLAGARKQVLRHEGQGSRGCPQERS